MKLPSLPEDHDEGTQPQPSEQEWASAEDARRRGRASRHLPDR
jgi:hypothetical protein